MVRLINGIITHPLLVIGGWISAFVIIAFLIRLNSDFETEEASQYATLGAYVFVLNSIPIPFQIIFPIPFPLTLSGVPLVIVILGMKRGLLISSAAMLLNHMFFPGSEAMLGLNITNMTIAALIVGFIPSLVYQHMGRRMRYLSGLIAGFFFVIIEGFLILLEFSISHPETSRNDFFLILEFLILFFLVLGIIEGLFTAIASSYYYNIKHEYQRYLDVGDETEQDQGEIEPIEFLDSEEIGEDL